MSSQSSSVEQCLLNGMEESNVLDDEFDLSLSDEESNMDLPEIEQEIEFTLLDNDKDDEYDMYFDEDDEIDLEKDEDNIMSIDNLIRKRRELMTSLQSHISGFNTTSSSEISNRSELEAGASQSLIELEIGIGTGTFDFETGKADLAGGFKSCVCSTPRRRTGEEDAEAEPPAIRVLHKWAAPSFFKGPPMYVVDEVGASDTESLKSSCSQKEGNEDSYDDIAASLRNTMSDTDSILDLCTSQIASFKEESCRDFDDIQSFIMNEFPTSMREDVSNIDSAKSGNITAIRIGEEDEDEANKTLVPDESDLTLGSNNVEGTNLGINNWEVKNKMVGSSLLEKSNLNEKTTIICESGQNQSGTTICENTIVGKKVEENIPAKSVVNNLICTKNKFNKIDEESSSLGVQRDDKEIDRLSAGLSDDEIENGIDQFDEEVLLASDGEGKELPKLELKTEKLKDAGAANANAPKELQVFISNDPDENRDNNNPNWDYLRNLGSDYERYKAVRARWGNIDIPNPKRNLGIRHKRVSSQKYNELKNLGKTKEGIQNTVENRSIVSKNSQQDVSTHKRPRSPSFDNDMPNSKKKAGGGGRELCTVLLDQLIKQWQADVDYRKRQFHKKEMDRLSTLGDCQRMEKQLLLYSAHCTQSKIDELQRKHVREAEYLMNDGRSKFDEILKGLGQNLDALRAAKIEVLQLHEFYPTERGERDKQSLMYLDEDEVQEMLEINDMMTYYEKFYS